MQLNQHSQKSNQLSRTTYYTHTRLHGLKTTARAWSRSLLFRVGFVRFLYAIIIWGCSVFLVWGSCAHLSGARALVVFCSCYVLGSAPSALCIALKCTSSKPPSILCAARTQGVFLAIGWHLLRFDSLCIQILHTTTTPSTTP